jgi:hypothetical protein
MSAWVGFHFVMRPGFREIDRLGSGGIYGDIQGMVPDAWAAAACEGICGVRAADVPQRAQRACALHLQCRAVGPACPCEGCDTWTLDVLSCDCDNEEQQVHCALQALQRACLQRTALRPRCASVMPRLASRAAEDSAFICVQLMGSWCALSYIAQCVSAFAIALPACKCLRDCSSCMQVCIGVPSAPVCVARFSF